MIIPDFTEEKYVEWDEDSASWCIFGVDTGHCYSTHVRKEAAQAMLADMTKQEAYYDDYSVQS
jgi:hypothetical protein